MKVKDLLDIFSRFNLEADVYVVDHRGTQHNIDIGWSCNGAEGGTKETCSEVSIYADGDGENWSAE